MWEANPCRVRCPDLAVDNDCPYINLGPIDFSRPRWRPGIRPLRCRTRCHEVIVLYRRTRLAAAEDLGTACVEPERLQREWAVTQPRRAGRIPTLTKSVRGRRRQAAAISRGTRTMCDLMYHTHG